MRTCSQLNSGLSDSELLALFDENCLDPCSVVGSSYEASDNFSPIQAESNAQNAGPTDALNPQNDNNSSFNLEAYLMTDSCSCPTNAATGGSQKTFVVGPSSEQSQQKLSINRSEDNLEELSSIDMTEFSQLQKEFGETGHLEAEITCDFDGLFLEDGRSERNMVADEHHFARPLPMSFACLFCPRRFPDKTIWRRHNIRHCKQFLRCTDCNIRMRSANAIRKHWTYHHVWIPKWKKTMIMFHDTV